jgi:ATP-dependent DNA helicase HFM1/MER3
MSIKASVETLFRREFKSLVENQAVEQEENNPGNYGATEYGKAMSRFYISLNMLRVFLENNNAGFNSIADILTLVGKACEFEEIRLKHSEKRFYKEMNKLSGIKYPIKAISKKTGTRFH